MSDRDDLEHSLDHPESAPAQLPGDADETLAATPAVGEPREPRRIKPAPEGLLVDDLEPVDTEQRLGRYRLEGVIGSGGMGVVYRAWDEVLRRRVAVKVLGPGAQSQVALDRFQQEALLTARLNHPHVVVVHEAGQTDGRAFIAMELVEGQSLEQWIDRRLGEAAHFEGEAREQARKDAVAGIARDDLRALCRQLRDVADALHHGHTYTPETGAAAPIIHRDVKPGNIMIDRHGEARLLDFGLAKELGVALTVTREALGTPLYMSPEQLFSAKRVGPRSDVYSLGMTLYACLTLARPFELSQPGRLFELLMHEDPRDPQQLNPTLPDDLRTIVLKATAKDERERYATAAALAADLGAFLAGREIQARPPSLWRRARRKARRHGAGLAASAAVGLVVAGGLLWQEVQRNEAWNQAVLAEQQLDAAQRKAQTQAVQALAEARVLFELAGANKAEDPEGERWLRVLNQGYELERQAFAKLAETGAEQTVEIRHRALLARLARNNAEAVEELAKLHAEAFAASRELGRLDALSRELAALDEAGWRGLLSAVRERARDPRGWLVDERSLSLAQRLTQELDAVRNFADREDPVLQAAIQSELAEKLDAVRPLATARPELARSLDEARAPRGEARVRVDIPGGEGTVRLHTYADGAPGRLVASGAAGTPLACDSWGPLLAVVTQAGEEARIRFDLPRPAWGSAQVERTLSLPLSLAHAPRVRGMRLVLVPGVDPFWIDAQEVTVADYALFLQAVAANGHATCPEEARAAGCDHTPRTERRYDPTHPVTGIRYPDALAYAAWAGKRLPTRAQWRAAAFAADPPRATGANLPGHHDGLLWAGEAGAGAVAVCGARGLVGNVAEWILRTDPDLPFREAAGGSWARPLPPAERGFCARYAPEARGEDLGFRCVVPINVPARERPAARSVDPADGRPMVLVDGGEFELLPERRPSYKGGPRARGRVIVSPYRIDCEPVSRRAFARFLEATGYVVRDEVGEDLVAGIPDHPALVRWADAAAYARWAGKRLPTEAEYDAAFQAERLWGRGPAGETFQVLEWCQDMVFPRFFDYAPRRDPVCRWGSEDARIARQGPVRKTSKAKRGSYAFRCVRDVTEETE